MKEHQDFGVTESKAEFTNENTILLTLPMPNGLSASKKQLLLFLLIEFASFKLAELEQEILFLDDDTAELRLKNATQTTYLK